LARPLSDTKRQAILDAAAELVASKGVSTSTAAIARCAAISDGALFIYFQTKDELLNQLFIKIKTDLIDTLLANFPAAEPSRERLAHLWKGMIGWGVDNLVHFRAFRNLKASDRITEESKQYCDALVVDALTTIERSLEGKLAPDRIRFYLGPVLEGLVEITIEAIIAAPDDARSLEAAGFDLFWNGLGIGSPRDRAT